MTELFIFLSFAACLLLSLLPGAIVYVCLPWAVPPRLFAGLSVCAILPICWAVYYSNASGQSLLGTVTSDPMAFWLALVLFIWLPGVLFYEYAKIKGSKYRHVLGLLAAVVVPVLSLTLLLPAYHKIFPSAESGVVVQRNAGVDLSTGMPPRPPSYVFPSAIDPGGKPIGYFSKECSQRIDQANANGDRVVTIKDICPNE